MKLELTEAGDLALQVEHFIEWMMVRGLLHDAQTEDFDLADQVGAPTEHAPWEDWHEWVAPDLRAGFEEHLAVVARALAAGQENDFPCPAVIAIPRAEFFHWYAALNHARLALEAKYHFGADPDTTPEDTPTGRTAAWHRSRFYSELQGFLLTLGLD